MYKVWYCFLIVLKCRNLRISKFYNFFSLSKNQIRALADFAEFSHFAIQSYVLTYEML